MILTLAQALPPKEALHPLIVHIPIGVLFVAWLPLVAGAIDRRRRWGWFMSGLLLMVVGTIGSFIAVQSGEAAAGIVPEALLTQTVKDAIHHHEELAETARTVFVVATVLVALTMLAGAKLKSGKRAAAVTIGVLLSLGAYSAGAMILGEASHAGGLLVHEHGVYAPMVTGETENNASTADESDPDEDAPKDSKP